MNEWRVARWWTAVLALGFLLVLAASVARAAGTGAISGQVTNGTKGGSSAGGLEVQLHTLAHDTGQEVGQPATTKADDQGRFSFRAIDTDSKNGYVATVAYQGITYASDVAVFQSGETAKSVTLKVYEPTSSADGIQLRQQHLVIDVDGKRKFLTVLDIAVIENGGDTAFVGKSSGGRAETFRVLLPPSAKDVQLGSRLFGNTVEIPGGFAYTGPITPGQTQFVLTYTLAYNSPTFTLTKTLALPAGGTDVLVAGSGVKVSSPELAAQPAIEMGGQKYQHLSGKNLAANRPIVIQLSGLPGTGLSPAALLPWLPVIAPILLIGGAIYVVTRRRARGERKRRPLRAVASALPDDVADDLLLED